MLLANSDVSGHLSVGADLRVGPDLGRKTDARVGADQGAPWSKPSRAVARRCAPTNSPTTSKANAPYPLSHLWCEGSRSWDATTEILTCTAPFRSIRLSINRAGRSPRPDGAVRPCGPTARTAQSRLGGRGAVSHGPPCFARTRRFGSHQRCDRGWSAMEATVSGSGGVVGCGACKVIPRRAAGMPRNPPYGSCGVKGETD